MVMVERWWRVGGALVEGFGRKVEHFPRGGGFLQKKTDFKTAVSRELLKLYFFTLRQNISRKILSYG